MSTIVAMTVIEYKNESRNERDSKLFEGYTFKKEGIEVGGKRYPWAEWVDGNTADKARKFPNSFKIHAGLTMDMTVEKPQEGTGVAFKVMELEARIDKLEELVNDLRGSEGSVSTEDRAENRRARRGSRSS